MPVQPLWIFIAGCGMAVYVSIAVLTDSEALKNGLDSLGVSGVITVLFLSVANYILRYVRWQYYLQRQRHFIPWQRHVLYYFAGFAFTVTPGKAGEAVRSFYLCKHEVPYADSLAVLFVERVVDFVAILILAVVFLLALPSFRLVATLGIVVTGVVIVAVASGAVSRVLLALVGRLSGRAADLCAHGARMFESSRNLLSGNRLAAAVGLGLLAWGAEGYGLFIVTQALGMSVDISDAIAIYAGAVLVGALAFFTPSGVGSMEVTMTALLVGQGSPLGVAVVATLICRLATLWFAVVLGLLAIFALHRLPASAYVERAS